MVLKIFQTYVHSVNQAHTSQFFSRYVPGKCFTISYLFLLKTICEAISKLKVFYLSQFLLTWKRK